VRKEIRDEFNTLAIENEAALVSKTVQSIWSKVSLMRMKLARHSRPDIPSSLTTLAEGLGAMQNGGTYYLTKDDGLVQGASALIQKAKTYNMDLHEADLRRHHALNERFHFNGSDRAHNN
jgi:hypothetical protein